MPDTAFHHVLGPIHSRWPGPWLAIDIVPAGAGFDPRQYAPPWRVLWEIREALAQLTPGAVAWLVFTGTSDPTLHADLHWMITRAKALTTLPVAVLTDGSLLHRDDVRADVAGADAVISASQTALGSGHGGWSSSAVAYAHLTADLAAFRAAARLDSAAHAGPQRSAARTA